MAAVAPAQPAPIAEPTKVEEVEDKPMDENEADAHDSFDEEHEHDDEEDNADEHEEEEVEVKEWDEGGKSHCGYGDSLHETLMSIGASIHKVVGEPNEGVQRAMKGIGNWFQEASYAARDLKRGKMDVAEETAAAMKSVVTNDEADGGEEVEGAESGELDGQGSGEEGGAPLTPVKEADSKAEAEAEATA